MLLNQSSSWGGSETSVASSLKIGEVAQQSGLSVKTIRYYEEIGLLTPTVQRSLSKYRLFSPIVLNRLAFIRRSQALGLSLTEIQELLDIHDRGELPCGMAKQRLQEKVQAITEQIQSLEILRRELQGLLSGWQDSPLNPPIPQSICPNIQSIATP